MSESGAKSSQALASKGEKDVSQKRGRGRPRKKPQVCGVSLAGCTAMPRGAGHPQAAGQREPPPTMAASPGRDGVPMVQPPSPPSGSATRVLPSSKSLLGGPQPPQLLQPQGGAQASPAPPSCS